MESFHTAAWPFAGQDIRSLLEWRREASRDRTFLVWAPFDGEERTWTYGAFVDWVERFAAGLGARGVRPGDRVLVHMENSPEFLVAWLGCAAAGVVAVTTNARSSAEEMKYYCGDAGAVAAVTQPKFAEMVASACGDLAWIATTATDAESAPSDAWPRSDRFDAISADTAAAPPRARDPGAPFSVQYTSGTTSRPKGVVWTHANALWGARVSAAHEDLREDDVHLTTMPLFHTNAQAYSVLATLWAGATVVLQPRFSASRFWGVALKHRCTWTSMVPFCSKALESVVIPERHHFRLWGNAYCSPPGDAMFGVKTIGWWGMTETISHGFIGLTDRPNAPMSMGRAAPEYEIRVLDDRGAPAGPGEVGDLAIRGVRGLSLFAEYLGNPSATAEAFDREGFLLTGDRVRSDESGFYFFADRAKDLLKVGGENVSAAEVERVILASPGVREVAVVGKPHPMLDEAPVAFIIPVDRDDVGLVERVATACRERLADFKRPHELRIVNELPRATLEKVAKSQLRALLYEERANAAAANLDLPK
jgi:carnitine-CoA ligase